MPKLVGTLERHKSTRDAWGVGVLRVTHAGADGDGDYAGGAFVGDLVTVVGPMLGLVAAGETLELDGVGEETKFGPQFRITRQASLGINSVRNVARFLERLDGVGPTIARAIETRFGDEILGVLNRGPTIPDPLTDVPGIGDDRARLIRESWEGVGASGSVEDLQYLDGLGCTRWEVQQILKAAKAWRLDVKELLETQPYSLTEAHGLGFLKVDAIARRAGCSPLAPARVEAGVRYVCAERIDDDGHTRLIYGQLVAEAGALMCVPATEVMRGCAQLRARGVLTVDATARPLTVTLTTLLEAARVVLAAVSVSVGGSLGALPAQVDVPSCEAGTSPPPAANVDECQAAYPRDGAGALTPAPSPAVTEGGDAINALLDELCNADPHGGAPWAWE